MVIRINNISLFFYGLVFAFCQFYPLVLKNISITKLFINICTILCILLAFVILVANKVPITYYDIICFAICISIFISGLVNTQVIYETFRMDFQIIKFFIFLKMMMIQSTENRRALLNGMSCYMVTICAISTIHILLVGGRAYGRVFLLGSDNGIANIYFIACFISYISWYFDKDKSIKKTLFFTSLVSTIVYAFVLEVGTAVLWVLSGIMLAVLKKVNQRVLQLKYLISTYTLFFGLLFAFVQSSRFINLVNILFYGKINSITSRMVLWKYFLDRMPQNILFGYGSGADKYRELSEGIQKWHLIGNNHNIFLESIYHYGFITFFLIVVVMILAILVENKSRKTNTVMGAFFFMFLMHSILENGIQYLFIYTTILYYYYLVEETVGENENYYELQLSDER